MLLSSACKTEGLMAKFVRICTMVCITVEKRAVSLRISASFLNFREETEGGFGCCL